MIADLWRASRPFSWINTALPFLAMAWAIRHGFTLAIVLGVVYFLAPYNLLLYGVNDLFDYESDRLNPRKGGAIEGGLVPPARGPGLWLSIAVTNLPLLAALAWVGGLVVTLALLITVFVAVVYSAPPLRTKVVPGFDSFTSSLHFVLPCVTGGLVAGAGLTALPWRILLAFFCWGIASHALGAIQDVRYDREAGVGSIAVSLGARNTALFSLLGYTSAVVLIVSTGGAAIVAGIALLPYVLLAASCLGGDVERQARRAWHGFLGLNQLTGFIITQLLLHLWVGGVTVLQLLAWGTAAGLLVLLGNVVLNEWSLRRRAGLPLSWPSVSIVIPARNEEDTLAGCLTAAQAQSYEGDYEVLVVDDGSVDRTVDIAHRALRDGNRLLTPGASPATWTGKCWAAQQGANEAQGEVLVFLDADTVLEPIALTNLVREVAAVGGLLSILTRYSMVGPAEHVFIPAFVHMQLCFLPLAWLNLSHVPPRALAYAYGPCMAIRRDQYFAAGGHTAIQASDREDIDLARLMAGARFPVRFLRGCDLAVTRHYPSLGAIIAAWRRTYYAYGGNSLAVALFGILGVTAVFLLPLLLPFVAIAQHDDTALAGSLLGLVALAVLRLSVAISEHQPVLGIAAHPLSWLGTIAFQAWSVFDGLRGRAPVWRDRGLSMERTL